MVVALCALSLAGCGGTAKTNAPPADSRADYQSAIDAYQACVNSNLKNVEGCEDKRERMDASERAYRGR
jgi:predicted small lipoprotein YifL